MTPRQNVVVYSVAYVRAADLHPAVLNDLQNWLREHTVYTGFGDGSLLLSYSQLPDFACSQIPTGCSVLL